MRIGTKIKLKPTKEQEILFWKSAGVARWAYNHFLAENERYYNETSKSIKESDVRKNINNVLKKTTHTWLKEVSSNVMKQGVKDANIARDRWFNGKTNKPKFKRQIQYKCKKYGREFVEADKWYPSSKKCSCCGAIKKDLKLKDRIFKCSCGFKLDRDLNAAINLANYSIQSV